MVFYWPLFTIGQHVTAAAHQWSCAVLLASWFTGIYDAVSLGH